MNKLLEDIFETRQFLNSKNEVVKIHSETGKGQCEYLQNIIAENNFKKSVEIGLAYGISSLAITEAISKNNGTHFIIDKFQYTDWGGNGIDLLNQAGYSDKIEFSENFCYEALPALLDQGRTFDFAYVDTTKLFDWILVDFFLIDKILDVNGIIVFDDVFFPGIRKALRYISQLPHYTVYSQFPYNEPLTFNRKIGSLLKYIPKSKRLIKDEITVTNRDLKINSHCVAIKKMESDKRNYDWIVDF